MERGQGSASAVQEVRALYGIPVVAIATLDDLMGFLGSRPDLSLQRTAVESYRKLYGAVESAT
jgi:orotate phosphoribosyltransferase